MAFTIERGSTHRPLGFSAAVDDGASASSSASHSARGSGTITVERWATDQQGATATLLAPPDGQADAGNRALRRALTEGFGELRGLSLSAVTAHPLAGRPTAAPSSSGRSPRGATHDAGFTALATALAAPHATLGAPAVVAGTRGIVDGELVSLLALASGRLRPIDRSPLRMTVLTDARLDRATLEPLLRESAEQALGTFAGLAAALPSDGVVMLANGLAQAARIEAGSLGFETLRVGLTALLQELMRALLEQAWQPAPACLVQVSVVGASDDAEAAAQAEALASSEELARAVTEALGGASATALRVGRFSVRRAKDGRQLAVAAELGRGRSGATRWTAYPR